MVAGMALDMVLAGMDLVAGIGGSRTRRTHTVLAGVCRGLLGCRHRVLDCWVGSRVRRWDVCPQGRQAACRCLPLRNGSCWRLHVMNTVDSRCTRCPHSFQGVSIVVGIEQ